MRRENDQAEGIRPNRVSVQAAILSVLAVGLLLAFPARGLGISPGTCAARHAFPLNPAVLTINDSVPYAQLILYRPDNQLSRKYRLTTNLSGTLEIGRKETIRLQADANVLTIGIDAAGHKQEHFTFTLTQGQTHYFRLQDRNNYAGIRAYLEVIEVTEATYRRDQL